MAPSGYTIPTRLGPWLLTNSSPHAKGEWIILAGDQVLGPDDTLEGKSADGQPISEIVAFVVFPWMEDIAARTAAEIIAAKSFLKLDEQLAAEAQNRSARREEVTAQLLEAEITHNEPDIRLYSGMLHDMDRDDADDLSADLLAADAAGNVTEAGSIATALATIIGRGGSEIADRTRAKIGSLRMARYGLSA
jgi:hypothetical protein